MKIFIVGNSRSGTTMLGRILGNHPQIHTFSELHFFENLVSYSDVEKRKKWNEFERVKLLERLLTSARDGLFSDIDPGKYTEKAKCIDQASDSQDPVSIYSEFLNSETIEHQKLIPCEQTPRYLFSADQIIKTFPDAVIVNIIRDPRDVLLSQKNKWRRRNLGAKSIPIKEAVRAWVNYHPFLISKLWVSSVRKANSLVTHEKFISIKFEDLLRNPDKIIKNLCGDIGIQFNAEMLQVPQIGSSSRADRPSLKGINSDRLQAWRQGGLSSSELAICERVAVKNMLSLGYETSTTSENYFKILCSMSVLILKSWLILVLNFNRTKDITHTLKERFFAKGE